MKGRVYNFLFQPGEISACVSIKLVIGWLHNIQQKIDCIKNKRQKMPSLCRFYFTLYAGIDIKVVQGSNRKRNTFAEIIKVGTAGHILCVAEENIKRDQGKRKHQQSEENVGLVHPVLFVQKKIGKDQALYYAQQDKKGKQVNIGFNV